MTTKFYACFILQDGSSSGCRELGGVVEVHPSMIGLNFEDVAELLAHDLEVATEDVRVYHFSRLH